VSLDPVEVQAPTGPEALVAWRLDVLQKVFTYMFAFLAALLLIEAAISLHTGQWHALPALAIAVLLQGIAAFARAWGIHARGAVFTVAACVGLGFGLPTLGFGLPIPFVVGAMTLTLLALCVGQRFALGALGALVAVMLASASFVCFWRAPLPVALGQGQGILDPNHFSNWLRVITVFAAVGVAIIFAVGFLVQRLEEAVRRNRHLFLNFEQASRDKIKALEEREILQAKVRRANELQVMGLLSATVAHDFNNLLMVILANASFLKNEVHSAAQESITDIEGAVERATDLCRRLLTLAGERVSEEQIADLNQIVEGELPILRRLVSSRVTLEWRPGPPLWVKCARTEMRQALLNLAANARDAMPSGGRLQISGKLTTRQTPEASRPRSYACLSISDTGIGMDAATREKIFEPFFTTKGKTKGTGLGMTVIAAAVEGQHGFLELDTELGKGTTFSLFFPSVNERKSLRPPASLAPTGARGEHILVVDDDEGARRILTRYLEGQGYAVSTASSGVQALALLRRSEPIHLVISDAVMPEMSGRELFDTVNVERPELPFLFCSGFAAGMISGQALEAGHRALLNKPFSQQELLEKVQQLLDAAHESNVR